MAHDLNLRDNINSGSKKLPLLYSMTELMKSRKLYDQNNYTRTKADPTTMSFPQTTAPQDSASVSRIRDNSFSHAASRTEIINDDHNPIRPIIFHNV